jgi:flagellar hook-length control protein FliK
VIAGSPNIVIAPTPTTGLPANSFTGTSPQNPFSAALQAATQTLLHPSLKSQTAVAKPGQPNSSTTNLKTESAIGSLSLQTATPGLESATNPGQALAIPVARPIPAAALLQPDTVDEAKLQAATLDAEQNQSTTQIARVGAAANGAQAMPSVTTGAQQFVPALPQYGSGTTGITGTSTSLFPGSQTTPLTSVLPTQPQANIQATVPSALQQPKPQPLGGFAALSVAAAKETALAGTESSKASSALTNQAALPAHPTKLTSQLAVATPQAPGNATPPASVTRSVPNQPDHSGLTTETKSQTAPATSTVSASSAPQIPLQMVMPDINVIKISPKPAEALQTAPGLTGPPANPAQPATEISKKNGDASGSGSGNNPSGTNKGSTSSSFASAPVNSQTSDSSAMPAAKAGDVSASSPLVGTQAAHAVVSGNDAPGASARTDAHAGEALPLPVAGNADIDARAQAAATYANSLLHSARLVERMGQTELRVGIQTGEFGNVDIRTSMVRNQVTAQISVERAELGKVLAAELPSLQNRLSEHRLPMANITLQNQSSGGSEGFGQGSRQSQTMPQTVTAQGSEGELAPVVMGLADASISSERLDVHM